MSKAMVKISQSYRNVCRKVTYIVSFSEIFSAFIKVTTQSTAPYYNVGVFIRFVFEFTYKRRILVEL